MDRRSSKNRLALYGLSDKPVRSRKDLVDTLSDFGAVGIDFVSYSENINMTTPHGKFFFTVIAAFAQPTSVQAGDR